MYRKGLIGMLRDHPVSIHELAVMLGQPAKDVEDDMHHLIKSLRNMPYRAVVIPAACRKCGFTFNKDKLHKPGKCPKCNSTWTSEPMISIEEK
jgi:predicted Zn-ribbon and HTH transcriptional regulator